MGLRRLPGALMHYLKVYKMKIEFGDLSKVTGKC
jgi:hypothetical protein